MFSNILMSLEKRADEGGVFFVDPSGIAFRVDKDGILIPTFNPLYSMEVNPSHALLIKSGEGYEPWKCVCGYVFRGSDRIPKLGDGVVQVYRCQNLKCNAFFRVTTEIIRGGLSSNFVITSSRRIGEYLNLSLIRKA